MKKLLEELNLWWDKTDIKALAISFLGVNFAFLYHTLNLMWGNHDVAFIKERLYLSSGLFEGRFTQFIPHVLLTNGQILPVLNNLIGFLFLVLGLWVLAKYWKIPKSVLNYVLFMVFFATEPYTLSWLYFTFITLSCLFWVLLVILGLYLLWDLRSKPYKHCLFLVSVSCFYLAIGGYPPVINTIAVCLTAKCVIEYVFAKKNLKNVIQNLCITIVGVLLAGLLVKMTLFFVHPDNVYNLELTPFSDMPFKFYSVLQISFRQFWVSLPFMEKTYKIVLMVMCFISFVSVIFKRKELTARLVSLIGVFVVILSASLTTFLVVPHTEYVARIDFYGLAFVYVFALCLLLCFKTPLLRSIGLIAMVILILLNIVNDYRAQKVWQQGFVAEMNILDQTVERIENHKEFNFKKKYRFYQIGDISLRPSYYRQRFDQKEPFLLDFPYLAMWQGGKLVEFFAAFDYIDHQYTLLNTDITPEVYDFMINRAEPWPHENSVYMNKDIIIVIYNLNSLREFQQKLRQFYHF